MTLLEKLEKAQGTDLTDAFREALRFALDSEWITPPVYMQACEQCNVAAYLDAALALVRDDAFLYSLVWDDEPTARPILAIIMHPDRPENRDVHANAARPVGAERGTWKRELARVTFIAALRARGLT